MAPPAGTAGAAPAAGRLPRTVRVINASMPRTGTATMAAALAILLDAPSYHCGTDAVGGPDAPTWAAAARAGTTPDWAALLDARGYGSIGDAPACFYWADLATAYPDAMVLLVERPPGPWAASFDAALVAVAPFFRTRWRSRLARHAWQICTRLVTPHCPGKAAGALMWPGSYSWYPILFAHPNCQILIFILTRRDRPFPLQETHQYLVPDPFAATTPRTGRHMLSVSFLK